MNEWDDHKEHAHDNYALYKNNVERAKRSY